MKRTKVYLDTSFINYLVATRLPEKMQESLDLWNVFVSSDRFEVVLSEIVYEELHACYEPNGVVYWKSWPKSNFKSFRKRMR